MAFVNLTPHAIVIGSLTIPASGVVARCAAKTSPAGEVDGVTLVRTEFGAVENLPDPEDGVVFVVSALVRAAVPSRTDVASPGDLVRNEAGQVVGCKNLVVN